MIRKIVKIESVLGCLRNWTIFARGISSLVGGFLLGAKEGIAWSPRNGRSVGHVDRGRRLTGEGGSIVVSGNRLAGTVTINFRILCGRRNPFPRSISATRQEQRGRGRGERSSWKKTMPERRRMRRQRV